ncbi:C-3 sterol dehydrogenase [Infundibulicybe gibba]|nr:C-3 sterol dehydrogenase [Infundibulicybe gibba]
MPPTQPRDVYLVIGGSGFLGRHIVQQLLDRGDTVAVFDIVQRYHDVPFYSGDISDPPKLPLLSNRLPTEWHHIQRRRNKGRHCAAVENGVRKLVFTSSAGVVFNGGENIDIDERIPYPEKHMDSYNETKAKAEEVVLAANGKGGLLTVALRPAGIFGYISTVLTLLAAQLTFAARPGDRLIMNNLYQVYERHQTHIQIGDNNNIFDWTYVGNVARAHLLAADKLLTPPPAPLLSELEKTPSSLDEPYQPHHRILPRPHMRSTTPGALCYISPNGKQLEAAFNDPSPSVSLRPVVRTRFDGLSDFSLSRSKLYHPDKSPLQVAGQVFFITNGEPCYFWDFARSIWHELDKHFPDHRRKRGMIHLPKSIGLVAATGSEWVSWLMGKEPTFTKFKVTFACSTRWHNIEKARRLLGYEPEVGIEDGIKRMVDWWYSEYQAGQHKQKH